MRNNDKWSKRVVVSSEEDDRQKKLRALAERKKTLFNKL